MSTYLKNIVGYKHSQLKSKSFDEIQKLFDKEMKIVNTFVDMNSEVVKGSKTRTEENSKRVGDELESDMSKKQKIDEHVEVKKDDQEEAEMKRHIEIIDKDGRMDSLISTGSIKLLLLCILYWKDNKELTVCPTCGISRWKVDNKTHKVYENIPAKVMWYFPIIPRLQRLFKLESISEDLRWHATRRITDGVLRHPADSQAWRTIDEKFPEIAKDPRNLRLGISADGVDVNSGTRHHSVWPVLSVIYNLPPWLCMKRKFIMLSVLISGYPGNDIDVFLEPLVDDLHTLFETGVDTYDASTKENFNLRAVVLWTINDYPALGTLCGCPYSGFKGCVVCGKDTHCVRLSASSKQSYAGHRRYLPYNHPFRRQKKAFNGQQEF
ncbi:putative transposon, En/Spm-like protein [Tanacetum coccineum]